MYRCALCHDSAAVNGLCSGCLNDLRGLYRDGDACCPVCGAASAQAAVCADCRVAPPPFVRLWGSLDYRPPVPALLHDWKHLRRSMMLYPLWTLMRGHPPLWLHTAGIDGVLAMPVSTRRRWQRGFNQCDELADAVCAEYGLPRIGRQAVYRRHRVPQSTLDAAARQDNIRGAFVLREPWRWRRVLVLDDVVTTGASVGELAWLLKQAGAEVFVWALARNSK